MEAIHEEMEFLKRNNTWVLQELLMNSNIINCKWVFRIKMDINEKENVKPDW